MYRYESIGEGAVSSFTGYPQSVGFLDSRMSLQESDELVRRYRVGMPPKDWKRTIFWQSTPDGKFVDADVVTITPDGEMQTRNKFGDCLKHYAKKLYGLSDTGFFGGELAADSDVVCIVQEPMECLLRAAQSEYVWMAVGYGRNLTMDKLNTLLGKKVVLIADGSAFEYWQKMAESFAGYVRVFLIQDF